VGCSPVSAPGSWNAGLDSVALTPEALRILDIRLDMVVLSRTGPPVLTTTT